MWKCSCGHENPNSARWCENCFAKGEEQQSYIKSQEKENIWKKQRAEEEKAKQERQKRLEEEKARKIKEQEDTDAFLKENGHDGFYEYRVINLYDNKSGELDTTALSNLLNSLGREGWHLRCAYSNELGHNTNPTFLGSTNSTIDQNILIMERFIKFK